ncbi:cupin domain-containing protein [Nonomuraea sp. NPDC005983]|uniref:cupin domain-containing protein n=1 Tax=Nonomuraea sp. NPDC005983 TaxID=3155595 RepID=UPI0033AF7FDF
MPENDPAAPGPKPRSTVWQTALTVLQEVEPPFIPAGAHSMTVVVEYPPGDPGAPPHRHPGPAFGYVLEGEMLMELDVLVAVDPLAHLTLPLRRGGNPCDLTRAPHLENGEKLLPHVSIRTLPERRVDECA